MVDPHTLGICEFIFFSTQLTVSSAWKKLSHLKSSFALTPVNCVGQSYCRRAVFQPCLCPFFAGSSLLFKIRSTFGVVLALLSVCVAVSTVVSWATNSSACFWSDYIYISIYIIYFWGDYIISTCYAPKTGGAAGYEEPLIFHRRDLESQKKFPCSIQISGIPVKTMSNFKNSWWLKETPQVTKDRADCTSCSKDIEFISSQWLNALLVLYAFSMEEIDNASSLKSVNGRWKQAMRFWIGFRYQTPQVSLSIFFFIFLGWIWLWMFVSQARLRPVDNLKVTVVVWDWLPAVFLKTSFRCGSQMALLLSTFQPVFVLLLVNTDQMSLLRYQNYGSLHIAN